MFTACRYTQRPDRHQFYTEFDEPLVEEIRLVSTLMLSVGYADGAVPLYPLAQSIRLPDGASLQGEASEQEIAHQIRMRLAFDRKRPWSDGPPPTVFGGPPYEFADAPAPVAVLTRIYGAFDTDNDVLIRGLGAFLKAEMLARHDHLFEAAHHLLFVSLEASFALVMDRLRSAGLPNPDAQDAGAYVEDALGLVPSGSRYFEDYYDDRIKTLHPKSRFGSFAYAPLDHCHLYHLRDWLREVYRLLILGEHLALPESA